MAGGMRTRSRTRALQERKQEPINITVNVHIHINQSDDALTYQQQPQPRYFTRLQRQRAESRLPPNKHILPSKLNLDKLSISKSNEFASERRPMLEKKKIKRRRIDMENVMADMMALNVGIQRVHQDQTEKNLPKNPFNTLVPIEQDAVMCETLQCIERCHVTTNSIDDYEDLAASFKSMNFQPKQVDVDLATNRLFGLSIKEQEKVDERHFIHHLMQHHLSIE